MTPIARALVHPCVRWTARSRIDVPIQAVLLRQLPSLRVESIYQITVAAFGDLARSSGTRNPRQSALLALFVGLPGFEPGTS